MSLYTVQNDQLLDLVRFINQRLSLEAVLDSSIHELDRIPVLVIAREHWLDVARLIHDDISMSFTYLRNISGVDYETHMQVVYQVYSFIHDNQLHIKVDVDRENPELASVADVWQAANWNEREIFDLLGIHFTGHPNLKRILMPDDWVGYPLRKDYEQLDQGV